MLIFPFQFIDVSWIEAKEDLEDMADTTSCPNNTSAWSTSTEKSQGIKAQRRSPQLFNRHLLNIYYGCEID